MNAVARPTWHDAQEDTARDGAQSSGAALEGEKLDAVDDALTACAERLAAGDLDGATAYLADAVSSLDALGEHDPATGRPRQLGTRLLAALRGIARAREDRLDAMLTGARSDE